MPINRFFTPPKSSFFLFGIRGVGKSTLSNEIDAALRINLLSEQTYISVLSEPKYFSMQLENLKAGSWVVVDEIQRVPSLLNEVHRYIEERKLKFVLLGSSARKLKTSGTNLLAGRALKKELYPFTPSELGAEFNLKSSLECGTIPLIYFSEDKSDRLRSYVETYIKEEIKAEALVRNLPGFIRFLPIAALYHAQTINVSNISRESEVHRNTVNGYIEILEDTLLVRKLSGYDGNLRIRERILPKLYWIDPGVVRAIKKNKGEILEEEKGALFEGFIFMLLLAFNSYYGLYDDIFYWSPSEAKNTEVDFLLKSGKDFIAIEVKSTTKYNQLHLKGLKAIKELKGIKRKILVYLGSDKLKTEDGIEILPFSVFEKMLADKSLF